MCKDACKKFLIANINKTGYCMATSQTYLSGFNLFSVWEQQEQLHNIQTQFIAAAESSDEARRRARASGSSADKKAFIAEVEYLKRLLADFVRLLMIARVFSIGGKPPRLVVNVMKVPTRRRRPPSSFFGCRTLFLPSFLFLLYQVFDLISDDTYVDWLDDPRGGALSPFATTQLAFLLERLVAAFGKFAQNTMTYTSISQGNFDQVNFADIVRAEKLFDAALDKIRDAMANRTPLKNSLPIVVADWQKPGFGGQLTAPPSAASPSFSTPSALRTPVRAEQPPAKKPKSTRFSNAGIGVYSNRGPSRSSFDAAEARRHHGIVIRINGWTGSALPECLRPQRIEDEYFMISGELASNVPSEFRRAWSTLSDREKREFVDYVKANRTRLVFNKNNNAVAQYLGDANSNLLGDASGPSRG